MAAVASAEVEVGMTRSTMSIAMEPTEDRGIKPEPHWVCRGRGGGEVILEDVGGDDHGEKGVPLGEDIQLEVEDGRDEGANTLDGGGFRP
jgi:hypothetical protein